MSDPGPEEKKITNADEQDVVVNHSTRDHGFDEPASADSPKSPETAEKENIPETDIDKVEEDSDSVEEERVKTEDKDPDSFKK